RLRSRSLRTRTSSISSPASPCLPAPSAARQRSALYPSAALRFMRRRRRAAASLQRREERLLDDVPGLLLVRLRRRRLHHSPRVDEVRALFRDVDAALHRAPRRHAVLADALRRDDGPVAGAELLPLLDRLAARQVLLEL